MNCRHARGSSLVGMLAAIVIVLILVMVWLYYGTGKEEQGGSQPLTSRITQTQDAARSTECRNNLSQIRQSIQVQQAGAEETFPASLTELRLPDTVLKCPVSGQLYPYDPSSGTVRCPTEGHMSF